MLSKEIEKAKEHLFELIKEEYANASFVLAITDGMTIYTDFNMVELDDVHLITNAIEKSLEEQISRKELIDGIDFEGGELGN